MLVSLFGSRLRARLLGWLLSHPGERYFVRQLGATLAEDSTNISRELAMLASMEIVTYKTEGRQKYYQANTTCPIYPELRGLILKTIGLVDVLRDALEPLADGIKVAFVYGSMAKGDAVAESDVDLMIVGDITLGDVVRHIRTAQDKLGREINPTVYRAGEFRRKIGRGHRFLSAVMRERRIFVIGDEKDLAALTAKRAVARKRE
ncbi:MAG: nucleotidyltransferase domain-containing protein [Planctomycetia bacterium]|nr:nucleotidyltransferase domain-containing protein [Planctomycetia bacterium]